MKKLIAFLILANTLHAFELNQAKIPLSTFGDVVYDIYSQKDTHCEASIILSLEESDYSANYLVTITPSGNPRFSFTKGSDSIDFAFEKLHEIAQLYPIESTDVSLKFNYIHTESQRQEVILTLPVKIYREQFALPGEYQIGLNVLIERAGEVVTEKTLPATIIVEEQSQVMISDSQKDAFQNTKFVQWNFGLVENEVTKNSVLSVRANYEFAIEIESKNRGALLYKDKQAFPCSIPFELTLGNQAIDLTKGPKLLPAMRNLLLQLPLSLTLFPDPKENLAGAYQDLLLVSIISMN